MLCSWLVCPRTRKENNSYVFSLRNFSFCSQSVSQRKSAPGICELDTTDSYIFLVVAVEQSEAANAWQLHLPDPMPGVVLRFPEIKGCCLLTKWVIIKKTKIKGTVLFKIVHPATKSVDQLSTEGSARVWGVYGFLSKPKKMKAVLGSTF